LCHSPCPNNKRVKKILSSDPFNKLRKIEGEGRTIRNGKKDSSGTYRVLRPEAPEEKEVSQKQTTEVRKRRNARRYHLGEKKKGLGPTSWKRGCTKKNGAETGKGKNKKGKEERHSSDGEKV